MKSIWLTRLLALLAVGAAVDVFLVAAGMGPRLMLVGAAVVVGATVVWFVRDVGWATETVDWPTTTTALEVDSLEWRVGSLERMLRDLRRDDGSARRLRELLVGLIDDRLADVHGIDRASDPHAAEVVLGPELTRFVSSSD